MRVPSNLSRGGLGFNMTPMIDVVFLLIIFFLVSSHMAKQEVELELDLPEAGSGQRPDEDDIRRVVVNVLPEQDAAARIVVGGRQIVTEELAQLIGFESRRKAGHLEVRIRADRTVPYRVVEPIMVTCAREGVWKVTFSVVGD
ncbi:MAG TPA: biopolymer transporter ExbD [Thermoguttaceae bacterium]|nr:biopolymer transporter ExbD [Thermoguttaceae bacterium]